MNEYDASVVTAASLTPLQRAELCDLYLRYYDGSDEALFHADLSSKTHVLLLRYGKRTVGFTTIEVYVRQWHDEPAIIIYSGDTIVEREHWGQQVLSHRWIRFVGELRKTYPGASVYWFLIVKGHRTYKFLPAFTRTFYPHWDAPYDDHLKEMLDVLAAEKFGSAYNPQNGIVSFAQSQGHLKEAYAAVPEHERSKPAVAFFLERNPGYARGDELACLCRFDDENLRPIARRILNASVSERSA